jgi:PAS domain-containing protein
MPNSKKTLWEILWDYDPNGLLVVDLDMRIKVVNTAFCRMFKTTPEQILGTPAESLLGDVSDFRDVWEKQQIVLAQEREYPKFGLHVRRVMFAVKNESIVAAIMVDTTHEWQQQNELTALKRETLERVNQVVNKQMHVAQEIAGMLGETTAEMKVSLRQLIETLKREID